MNPVTRLLIATILFFAPAFASVLVINDTDTAIRFPFGADTASLSNYQTGATYQQIYSSQEFVGSPILITQLAFATSSLLSDAPSASVGLDIHLGIAAGSPGNPSPTFAANRGSNYQDVFSNNLTFTPARNNTFDMILHLSGPFLYDPSKGDLLLDVSVTQAPGIAGSALYFGGDSSDTDHRIFNTAPSADGRIDFNTLATEFTFTPQSAAVPEPSSLFLLGAGFGTLVFAQRRVRVQRGNIKGR